MQVDILTERFPDAGREPVQNKRIPASAGKTV